MGRELAAPDRGDGTGVGRAVTPGGVGEAALLGAEVQGPRLGEMGREPPGSGEGREAQGREGRKGGRMRESSGTQGTWRGKGRGEEERVRRGWEGSRG